MLLCTVNTYAAAIQLKEKLRESDMVYAVTRGKCGGAGAAATLFECIVEVIRESEEDRV